MGSRLAEIILACSPLIQTSLAPPQASIHTLRWLARRSELAARDPLYEVVGRTLPKRSITYDVCNFFGRLRTREIFLCGAFPCGKSSLRPCSPFALDLQRKVKPSLACIMLFLESGRK